MTLVKPLTRSQLAALHVFLEGGNAWRPMGYKGTSAWLCPVRGGSKRVSSFTLKALESAGHIEGYEDDSDWRWRLVANTPEMIECPECCGTGEVQVSCETCDVPLTKGNVSEENDECCKECASEEGL